MKKINYLLLVLAMSAFCACGNENGPVNYEEKECIGTQEFIFSLRDVVHKKQTRGTSEEDFPLAEVIEASIKYLEINGVSYTEFFEDRTDPRIIVVALATAEYFSIPENQTRGSLGACTLSALGITQIYKDYVKGSVRAVIKTIGKTVAKKAIPAVGWGVFAGELVWCLID